jgi:hypothetical protein
VLFPFPDPKKGMIGFYAIIIGFVVVDFIVSSGSNAGWVRQFAQLGWLLGVFIVVSLLR